MRSNILPTRPTECALKPKTRIMDPATANGRAIAAIVSRTMRNGYTSQNCRSEPNPVPLGTSSQISKSTPWRNSCPNRAGHRRLPPPPPLRRRRLITYKTVQTRLRARSRISAWLSAHTPRIGSASWYPTLRMCPSSNSDRYVAVSLSLRLVLCSLQYSSTMNFS